MGQVYAATQVITGKRVALKLVRPSDEASADRAERFLREARIATALKHPNVVEIHDVFLDTDGTAVMVMELLQGEPLSTHRARAGRLTLHQAAEILVPIARALQTAHARGVIHRDLKPANIFLTEPGVAGSRPVPKLLDFGIAKILDPVELGAEAEGQPTRTGAFLGTPGYMSFEQAMSDKEIDRRTDIWSLGVILFEALAGRRPIAFETLGEMYAAFLQGSIPSAADAIPSLPADVASLLDRCLVRDKRERLGDLRPFIETLGGYAENDGAQRSVPPQRFRVPAARLPRAAAMAGLAALAAIAAGVAAWSLARTHDPKTDVAPSPIAATEEFRSSVPEPMASGAVIPLSPASAQPSASAIRQAGPSAGGIPATAASLGPARSKRADPNENEPRERTASPPHPAVAPLQGGAPLSPATKGSASARWGLSKDPPY
jgi:serine/threonine-protein kinase